MTARAADDLLRVIERVIGSKAKGERS